MTSTDIRLVPMSREMRENIEFVMRISHTFVLTEIVDAYDNAPADPREVIAKTIWMGEPVHPEMLRENAVVILSALGWTQEETT